MANLLIDQGNSSAKVAVMEDDELVFLQKYAPLTVREVQLLLEKYSVRQAILSSVVELDAALDQYMQANCDKWLVLSNDTPIPLENLYKTPRTLGRDRIAVCVGANSLYPNRNALIIDVGTAITYDVVNAKNQYVGGNISLGIEMRRKALHAFTAKLPLVTVPDVVPTLGTTTDEAIASGIINGIAYEIDGYIDQMKAVYPELLVFLTGGSTKCFEKIIKNRIFALPNLVLTGLNRILEYK